MKKGALLVAILLFCLFAPNLVWLVNSTARITNAGADIARSVVVHVDDQETRLGDLSPGERRFVFLSKSGDATYRVSYKQAGKPVSVCAEYVEGDMYHVETILQSSAGEACTVSLPLLSDLFITKLIARGSL